ncbi:MAG: ribosome maturation factor RimM [Gammaproteobacteria bacterium]
MSAERVIVGRLAGVYGVRGWLRVQSYTQPLDNILRYSPWSIDGETAVAVTQGKAHGKGLVVHLDGVDDRDVAAKLIGREISVDREQLPTLSEGDYYWSDLIGLTVVNLEGDALGTVTRMLETGAHDVMVIDGDRERLVPYARERVVHNVDLEAGRILVDWDAAF